jgi:hypothetical protein
MNVYLYMTVYIFCSKSRTGNLSSGRDVTLRNFGDKTGIELEENI